MASCRLKPSHMDYSKFPCRNYVILTFPITFILSLFPPACFHYLLTMYLHPIKHFTGNRHFTAYSHSSAALCNASQTISAAKPNDKSSGSRYAPDFSKVMTLIHSGTLNFCIREMSVSTKDIILSVHRTGAVTEALVVALVTKGSKG